MTHGTHSTHTLAHTRHTQGTHIAHNTAPGELLVLPSKINIDRNVMESTKTLLLSLQNSMYQLHG